MGTVLTVVGGSNWQNRGKDNKGGYSPPVLYSDNTEGGGYSTPTPNPTPVGQGYVNNTVKPGITPIGNTVTVPKEQYIDNNVVFNSSAAANGMVNTENPTVSDPNMTYGGNPITTEKITYSNNGVNTSGGGASSGESPTDTTYADNGIATGEGGENVGEPKEETSEVGKLEDEIDTYEYWLKYIKDKTTETADATYAEALRRSEVARERAAVDARSAAALRESSYGANAEALESMGLSASGYGDYVGAQSYAQMRSDVQAANAQKAASDNQAAYNRDQTKLGAELTYAEGMAQKTLSDEQTKDSTYLELLSGAGTGAYSAEQIKALGEKAGLSAEEIDRIISVATKYETNYRDSQWIEIKNGVKAGKYDAEYVTDWAKANGYVNEDGTLNAEAQAVLNEAPMWTRYNWFMADIENNGVNANIDAITKAEAHGEITPEMYENLMAAYNIVAPGKDTETDDPDKDTDPEKTSVLAGFRMTIRGSEMNPNEALDYALSLGLTEEEFRSEYSKVISENVGEKMFEKLSAEEAKDVYEGLINDPYVDGGVKDKVREYYANYEGAASTITQNVSIDKAPNNYREKGNFVINLSGSDGSSGSYKVELGKMASDTTSDRLSSTYKNEKGGAPTHGALIVEQGRLFIYFEGKTDAGWVMVQRRAANGYAQSFKNLCAALGITYYSERGEEI